MPRSVSPDIAVNEIGSSGSGNGAPDGDLNQLATATRTASRSTVIALSTPYSDLGPHVQSLRQKQLTQDQKEKEALQQRVSRLEAKCKIAEKRAKDEHERAEKLASEVDLARQDSATSQSLLQQSFSFSE